MRSSLTVSLVLHAAAFAALMYAPAFSLPERGKSEYKLAITGKEEKLVWYKFDKDLPDVGARSSSRPVRGDVVAKQEIVASPKNANKRTQIVWTPAPELPSEPVELPNLLAVKLPPLRHFVTPPDIQKPPVAPVETLPDAPAIPKILKQFVPPPTRVPRKLAEVVAPAEAPLIALNTPAPDLNYRMKAPTRPFTPPLAQRAPAAEPVLPNSPPPLIGNSPDLNVAVVGLNPADKFAPLPVAPSPAQFSAAPQIRKDGAESTGASGITVPDVYVRGARDPRPSLMAEVFAAPTSDLNMREAMRLAQPARSASPPAAAPPTSAPAHVDPLPVPRGAAIKVSGAPDPRFNDRDVYMMAIQMPNLTSNSGSWLMWYADRTAREIGLAPVSPPIAHRKVDPKYVGSAVADRVEGKIQLACVIGTDGLVSNIEIVRGLDSRLNSSAVEALGKWQFSPALRDGEPVAVDVLVEIPFRLAPLLP